MFVVTLPLSAAKDPRAYAQQAKQAGAEALEIRGDFTPDVQAFDAPLPLLVSPRGMGRSLIDRLHPQLVDLEAHEDVTIPPGTTLIRSFHNHASTPPLDLLREKAAALQTKGADILKVATHIDSYKDLRTLEDLRESLPSTQKTVMLGMGEKAHLSRLLSPLRNALTYARMDGQEGSAPGQIALSLYTTIGARKQPKIFGLLGGRQIAKSFSPAIHNTLFSHHGVDALYTLFPTEDLATDWADLSALGVEGFSVTSPWKEHVGQFLTDADLRAYAIESYNTMIRQGGGWVGHATDVEGIAHGYPSLGSHASVAIIGTGGVVPAILSACEEKHIRDVTVYGRNQEHLAALAARFDINAAPLSELKHTHATLIICALPVDTSLDLPPAKDSAEAIDLRYGQETAFLRRAKELGYRTYDGLPMLHAQALEQFRFFTGITPDPSALPSPLQT